MGANMDLVRGAIGAEATSQGVMMKDSAGAANVDASGDRKQLVEVPTTP